MIRSEKGILDIDLSDIPYFFTILYDGRLRACSFFYLLSHLADIIKIVGICAKGIEVMIYMAVPGTF